jgi:hypothetical protein
MVQLNHLKTFEGKDSLPEKSAAVVVDAEPKDGKLR